MRMLMASLVIALATLLAGCSHARIEAAQQQQEQALALARNECMAKYPDRSPSVNSNRYRCWLDRTAYLNQNEPFADIRNLQKAQSMEIYIKLDRGALSVEQANTELAATEVRATNEIQRRMLVQSQMYPAVPHTEVTVIQQQRQPAAPTPALAPTDMPSCADGYACAGRTLQGDGRWH